MICVPFQAKPSSLNQHRKISFNSVLTSVFLDQDNKLIYRKKQNKRCFSKDNEFTEFYGRSVPLFVNLGNDIFPV